MADHPNVVGYQDAEWSEQSYGEEIPISEGGYVALPTRAEAAHQIVNDSEVVLRYLCFSTMVEPDVMIYPDSGKVGIFGGAAPGGPKEKRNFNKFLRGD